MIIMCPSLTLSYMFTHKHTVAPLTPEPLNNGAVGYASYAGGMLSILPLVAVIIIYLTSK